MAGGGADVDATVAANDEERPPPEQRRRRAQQKRARTGCERCRTRRRKCDEQKPQCRRCADADAECRYITRLSFLDKNAQTLSHGPVSATESDRPGYPTVQTFQFVANEAPAKQSETAVSQSSPLDQNAGQDTVSTERTAVAEQFHEPLQNGGIDDSKQLEKRRDVVSKTTPDLLVSLDCTLPDTVASFREFLDNNHEVSAAAPQSSISIGTKATPEPSAKGIALTHNAMELFKYYSCCIAPWLDIADLGQTFSLLVPRLAMASPLVLDAVLKVSAVASGSSMEDAEQCRNGLSDLQATSLRPGQVPDIIILQALARSVLLKTQTFFESVPDTWDHIFVPGGPVPSFPGHISEDASYQRIWFAMIALQSRLEIAYSLVHEMAPAVGSEILREMLASSESMESEPDDFQNTLNASLSCLALLADVMTLCLPPEDQDVTPLPFPGTPHRSKTDRWKWLLSELRAWHIGRPLELQELAELEGRGASFPTVLFTSGAGVSANITYHVAMFLLLRHRPRTMLSTDGNSETRATETHASPLWHARRACGIALSSDPQHTQPWDPCMIAAFALTARQMTHPAQQAELLACLDRVKASGWRVDSLARSLRDEWGPFGPG